VLLPLACLLGGCPPKPPPKKPVTPRVVAAPEPLARDLRGDTIPRGAVVRLGTVRLRHATAVTHLAFSPDSKLLVSVASKSRIHIWDASDGRPLAEVPHPFLVRSLAFTPDGKHLATGTEDGKVQLWTLPDGKMARSFEVQGEIKKVLSVAFHPDGLRMATGGREFVRLWRLDGGKNPLASKTLVWQRRWVTDGGAGGRVAFTPAGKHLVSVARSAITRAVATGRMVRSDSRGSTAGPLALSTNGRFLVTRGVNHPVERTTDRDVQLRDLRSPGAEPVVATRSAGQPIMFATSRAGLLAAVGGDLRVCAVSGAGRRCRVVRARNTELAAAIALSPDGRTLAAGGRDHTVRLWDTRTGHEVARGEGHQGHVHGVTVSPDGRVVASTGQDKSLRFWSVATARVTRVIREARRAVAFSADGKLVAAGCDSVCVWDAKTGARVARLRSAIPSSPMAFMADSRTVVAQCGYMFKHVDVCFYDGLTGSLRGRLRLGGIGRGRYGLVAANGDAKRWRGLRGGVTIKDGRPVGPLYLDAVAVSHKAGLLAMAIEAPADVVIGGRNPAPILVVDQASRSLRYDLYAHQGGVRGLAFSPEGRYLASVGADSALRIKDMTTGDEVGDVVGHEGQVRAVAYSPWGGLIATAGDDRRIKVWRVVSAETDPGEPTELEIKATRDLPGHRGRATSVAFSADGLTVISGSHDTSLLVWNLAKDQKAPPPKPRAVIPMPPQ